MVSQALGGRGQYTAFNAPLCAEAKVKMPSHVAVNTVHSLAFRAEGHKYKHRLNTGRVKSEEVARRLGIGALELVGKRLAPGFLASQVLGAVRRFCNSADVEVGTQHFAYQDGLDAPGEGGKRQWDNNNRMREHLLPFARRAWEDLSSTTGTLPFTHDVYAKLFELNNPIISCDYLLCDEFQDMVPRDISIIRKQTCQVIVVGDSNQTIYAWRGCEDALEQFPEAPTFYLSQSFRFGQEIADVANAVLATLEEPTALRLKGLELIKSRVITRQETQNDSQGSKVLGTIRTSGEAESQVSSDGTASQRTRNRSNGSRDGGVPREVGEDCSENREAVRLTILCRTNATAVAALLGGIAEGKRPFLVGGGADGCVVSRTLIDSRNAARPGVTVGRDRHSIHMRIAPMSLSTCPDCGNQVSSLAYVCPKCGRPVHDEKTTLRRPDRTQPIELTGKPYKLGMLIGLMMWLGGCIATFGGREQGGEPADMVVLSLVGFVVMVVFKILAWWHHG